MKILGCAITVILLASLCGASAPAPNEMPVFGATAAGFLYGGLKRSTKQDILVREPLFPAADAGSSASGAIAAAPTRILTYAFPHWSDFYGPLLSAGPFAEKLRSDAYGLRWHMRDGRLWYVGGYLAGTPHFPLMRLPLRSVGFAEVAKSETMTDSLTLPKEMWPPAKPAVEVPHGTGFSRDGSIYFPWVSTESGPLGSAACQERSARIDIYPESAQSCLAFISVQPGRMEQPSIPRLANPAIFVFRYRFDAFHDVPTDQMCWAGLWTETDRLPAPSLEPFRVVVKADSYFFAAQSGSLYEISRKSEDGRRMRLVWDATSLKPIVAMLEDSNLDRTYAFTTDHFFEVRTHINPQPCNLGPAAEISPIDPLAVLRCCAATLVNRGLIKPPDTQKDPPAPKSK